MTRTPLKAQDIRETDLQKFPPPGPYIHRQNQFRIYLIQYDYEVLDTTKMFEFKLACL